MKMCSSIMAARWSSMTMTTRSRETKPEAASEALPDYQGDAEVAAAEAAEENEGEIQPVSADGETPQDLSRGSRRRQ